MKKETFSSLAINGQDGPIKNTLVSMGKTDSLAIVFPGIGYTCQMPLLYYTTKALLRKGYDVLWVEYNYTSGERALEIIREDGEACYNAAMARGGYKKVAVVSKSLGTIPAGHIADLHKIGKMVFFTPPLSWEEVPSLLRKHAKGQLLFIGSADKHHIKERVEEITKIARRFVVIEGADHSLEVEDPKKSLEILDRVVKEVEDFA